MQTIIPLAGLQELQDYIINSWLGPVFIIGIAAFALIFIKDRAWMKLISFVGIAAVVGVLVFGGSALFGKDGSLQDVAEGTASKVKQ
jgi:hypothetical protein